LPLWGCTELNLKATEPESFLSSSLLPSFLPFEGLEIESRASCRSQAILGKCSTTEILLKPLESFLILKFYDINKQFSFRKKSIKSKNDFHVGVVEIT
jgi:hypothetical protein